MDIIEIPFGSNDSELKGWEYTIPEGMEAVIKDGKVIIRQKESEDERIRKNILALVKKYAVNHERCQMETYLEKKKEQKPAEWSEEDEKALKIVTDVFKEAGVHLIHYPALLSWLKSLPLNLKKKNEDVTKLCSNEWSEEDKVMLNAAIEMVENSNTIFCFEVNNHKVSNWLKSLPERFNLQPMQKWSEEDEHRRQQSINVLERNGFHALADWLKSLRPSWKPSEEQMEALSDAYVEASTFKMGDILESLYNDLKKL